MTHNQTVDIDLDQLLAEVGSTTTARQKALNKHLHGDTHVQQVLAHLQEDGGFIDEHTNRWKAATEFAVYVYYDKRIRDYASAVVPVDYKSFFTINPIVIDKNSGKCHLRREAIGGLVHDDTKPITERLRAFNRAQSDSLVIDSGTFFAYYRFQGASRIGIMLI